MQLRKQHEERILLSSNTHMYEYNYLHNPPLEEYFQNVEAIFSKCLGTAYSHHWDDMNALQLTIRRNYDGIIY